MKKQDHKTTTHAANARAHEALLRIEKILHSYEGTPDGWQKAYALLGLACQLEGLTHDEKTGEALWPGLDDLKPQTERPGAI